MNGIQTAEIPKIVRDDMNALCTYTYWEGDSV